MHSGPVFYDPRKVRRKQARRIILSTLLITAGMLVLFVLSILQSPLLPSISLPHAKRGWRSVGLQGRSRRPGPRRKRSPLTSHVAPAKGQALRGAFFVNWDPTSFTALREHHQEIDLLIPEWLHLTKSDGTLRRESDHALLDWLQSERLSISVMPLVNNFDAATRDWRGEEFGKFLRDPTAQKQFLGQLDAYLQSRTFAGLVLDFEEVPENSQAAFREFVKVVTAGCRRRGLKVLAALPAADPSYDYRFFGQHTDGVILMNYDEHWPASTAGPVASQAWFARNIQQALQTIAADKLMVAIGSHGYDWILSRKKTHAQAVTFQEAVVTARESEATISLDPEALNPHFEYYDEHDRRHSVWFLDAVSTYNQVVASDQAGVAGIVLWRLGSEDPTLWNIYDERTTDAAHRQTLETTEIWYDLVRDGSGELIQIADTPRPGKRSLRYDPEQGMIVEAKYTQLPVAYRLEMYGAQPRKVVLSFDDGPDPDFTPKILDTLKAKQAPAVFFVTGLQANKYAGLLRRIYKEGHEIGNHTFTHPDISQLPSKELQVELNLSQRLFESELGVKTIFFRPPYDVDSDPDTPAEVAPLVAVAKMGYLTVGNKIDPKDYLDQNPGQIVNDTMRQLSLGNVVLLHDGGGGREATVSALPALIDQIRSAGYEIVPLREQVGKTYAEVMPPMDRHERWVARGDVLVFNTVRFANLGIAWLFIVSIGLVMGRLILIGILAFFQKLRPQPPLPDGYRPQVTVLIPAYNEETCIVGAVEAALASDWPDLDVLVVDDGSTDATFARLQEAFAAHPRVRILRQPNRGKPAALKLGLSQIEAEIFVGVDADTRLHPSAIRFLVRHFANPSVAAVAGNAKVGNRECVLTRWQALEYITSQNLERRAFDLLNCITVVPGAVGAWRTAVVRECGGFSADTVAEDTDLTLSIRRRGYRILYDENAIGWTEAPTSWLALSRQRFRWTFGTLQAVWKHRDTLARRRYGTLGWVALPNILVFQILLPLFSPLVDLMLVWSVFLWGAAQALQHWTPFILPQALAVSNADLQRTVLFFLIFSLVDLLTCELAFLMEKGESQRLLLWLVPQRFAYRQMMYFVLFRTLFHALQGSIVGWDRVEHPAASSA